MCVCVTVPLLLSSLLSVCNVSLNGSLLQWSGGVSQQVGLAQQAAAAAMTVVDRVSVAAAGRRSVGRLTVG